MSLLRRNRWFLLAGAITLVFAVVSMMAPSGPWLTVFFDIGYLVLALGTGIAMLATAFSAQGAHRRFWVLMAAGIMLLASNQASWVYCEVLRHAPVPDPWFRDIYLFLHLVPMIAAAALRPHRAEGKPKFRVGTLDFFLLLVWWIFLYAFVVFPSQYVSVNMPDYDRSFSTLYVLESGVLILVLGIAARGAQARWKTMYLNLMMASALYALASQGLNLAAANGNYSTGSLYDVPLLGAVSWMAASALTTWEQQPRAAPPEVDDKWGAIAPRLAMLAILSLPLLGLWTFYWDESPAPARTFRLFTILVAMLVLGTVVFFRQYLQDRALIRLLDDSRRTFENERRLQSHLVQREKLASLGQLVAGAAHEIQHPLSTVIGNCEKLWSNQRLTGEQDALVRKIVSQSHRTGDLVASLLSFAQQSSGEESDGGFGRAPAAQCADARPAAPRSEDSHRHFYGAHASAGVGRRSPVVSGLRPDRRKCDRCSGGGRRRDASRQRPAPGRSEVVAQFADSGPGIKDPARVFDPFYTTKPIGKGTRPRPECGLRCRPGSSRADHLSEPARGWRRVRSSPSHGAPG